MLSADERHTGFAFDFEYRQFPAVASCWFSIGITGLAQRFDDVLPAFLAFGTVAHGSCLKAPLMYAIMKKPMLSS